MTRKQTPRDHADFGTLKTCLRGLLREFGERDFVRLLQEVAAEEKIDGLREMCDELLSAIQDVNEIPTSLP